jgi:hypothetical protein
LSSSSSGGMGPEARHYVIFSFFKKITNCRARVASAVRSWKWQVKYANKLQPLVQKPLLGALAHQSGRQQTNKNKVFFQKLEASHLISKWEEGLLLEAGDARRPRKI